MNVIHTVLDAVAYAAPFAYLILINVSMFMLRTRGRRWQHVMDEFRALDDPVSGWGALRFLTMWLILALFLVPIIRPDVFEDAPAEAEAEVVS